MFNNMKMHQWLLYLVVLFVFSSAAMGSDCQTAASTDRFDTDANGTVTEMLTGLTWMRCALGQQWDGTTCKGAAIILSWPQAEDYIEQLNNNGGYASFTDWRMPKLNELATISELRCGPPRINTMVFPNAQPEAFWTKNATPGNAQYAYIFSFGNIGVDSSPKTAAHYVRLVRGRD